MAARFWVGGTATWDASTTTNWSASSGGAGGASVPGSSDTVTFDASSGGGTVTVNTTVAVQSITFGAFTGTLDFSVNNNNVTVTVGISGTGTGVRSLKMGSGTWTVPAGASTNWSFTTTTNLTFNAGTSTLVFAGGSASQTTFASSGLTYYNVTLNSSAGGYTLTGAPFTVSNNLTINAPANVYFVNGATTTIGTLILAGGSLSALVGLQDGASAGQATISSANNPTNFQYCFARSMVFTGGGSFAATNAFDMGNNTGYSASAPSGGGATLPRMIGG